MAALLYPQFLGIVLGMGSWSEMLSGCTDRLPLSHSAALLLV